MASPSPLFDSVTSCGAQQQREQHHRLSTPLDHHVDLPHLSRAGFHLERGHSPPSLSSHSSSHQFAEAEFTLLEPTSTTSSHFALWSRTSCCPIDSIAANDILRSIPSHPHNRSYSMLPTPPNIEESSNAVHTRRADDKDSSQKRNSLAGLSFNFPSLTSPARKGLISTVSSAIVPGRRPDTPPMVAKAWQSPPASTSKFKEARTSRQSPARTTHASPSDRSRAISTKTNEEQGIHSWSDAVYVSRRSVERRAV